MKPTHGDQREKNTPAQSAEPRQVCVLWHAPGTHSSDQLITVMKNRGFAVTCVSNQHAVVAAVCRLAESANRVVLVLDERDDLVGVDRVLDAIDRFSPATICWEYQPGSNPPMVPVVRIMGALKVSDPELETEPLQAVESSGDAGPVDLRLVPQPERLGDDERKSLKPIKSTGALKSSDVLDDDELNALLAGEMGD